MKRRERETSLSVCVDPYRCHTYPIFVDTKVDGTLNSRDELESVDYAHDKINARDHRIPYKETLTPPPSTVPTPVIITLDKRSREYEGEHVDKSTDTEEM